MQRSVRPSPTPFLRRGGAVLGAAALLLSLGAGAAQAHDGSRHGQRDGRQWQQTQQTTGAYVYLKKDVRKPASWENSTQQYLVTTWPGASYRDLTLDEVLAAVPAGVTVCGAGWAVQEDQANGDSTVFTGNPAPSYPHNYIGWGPIVAARHWELADMVAVPACGAVAPTATPTVQPTPTSTPTPTASAPCPPSASPTPTATPTATPAPTPTVTAVPVPAPTVTPTAEVGGTAAPTPTPTVVTAARPVATPSESFYSEVLAAGGDSGAVLASTGSSTTPVVLAGSVLVLAGAALVLLCRRRAA